MDLQSLCLSSQPRLLLAAARLLLQRNVGGTLASWVLLNGTSWSSLISCFCLVGQSLG